MNLKKEIRLPGLTRKSEKMSRRSSPAGKKRSRLGGGGASGGKGPTGELVGVKLGATQIAAARVANGGSGPKLLQVERQTLSAGIVVSGEVHDVPALAAGLDEFFRTNKLPRRGVRIGLATNHVGVRVSSTSLASRTTPSSRTRCSSGPTRSCRSRSTRPSSTTASSAKRSSAE